jgi:hypothetical protein
MADAYDAQERRQRAADAAEMRDAGVLVGDREGPLHPSDWGKSHEGSEPAVWVRLDDDACKCIIESVDNGWNNAEISIEDDQMHQVAKICRQLGIGKQTYQVRFDIPAILRGCFDVEAYTMDEAEAAGAEVTEDMDYVLNRATDHTGRVVGDIDLELDPDWHNQTISAEEF